MTFKDRIKYFMKGMGSSLQIYPEQIRLGELFPYYDAKSPQEQDARALASDWNEVGKDMEHVIKKFEREILNGNKKS